MSKALVNVIEAGWLFLRKHNNLKIKKSLIPNGGKGLFATADFKSGEFITRYTGDLTSQENNNTNSKYILQLTSKVSIDAARTNSDSGRMVNDPRGSNKPSNCKFIWS